MMVASKEKKAVERAIETPPFERLRNAFIVGRPSEVTHTPVSGVAAAQAELVRLQNAIKDLGMQAQAQVALVVVSAGQDRGGRLFVVGESAQSAAAAITGIASLEQPRLMGLVYAVVDPTNGDYEFWTKAFLRGRFAEKILDMAVTDGLQRLQRGETK